jgi:hypothetical protein
MYRNAIAASLVALAAAGCAGSQSEPSGNVDIVVTLGTGAHPAAHHYTLRCGPAGGTMPDADAACNALADYVEHRSDPMRFCSGFSATVPRAVVRGLYDGHRLRLTLTSISWCGVSDALMRDFWVISTFPCSTRVIHYASQHAYSKGIAPSRCLRGSSGAT